VARRPVKKLGEYVHVLVGMSNALMDRAFGDRSTRAMEATRDAAWDLGELYVKANGFSDLKDLTQFVVSQRGRITGTNVSDEMSEELGYAMARLALGMGDDGPSDRPSRFGEVLKRLPDGHMVDAIVPSFHIELIGDELVWDGGVDDLEKNPAGLTAKGERMYEDIKRGYGKDARAKEIAARTVRARAKEGVAGLFKKNSCSCSFSHTHNPSDHWPKSEVQSLLFDRHMFTEAQAKAWAKEHGYLYGSVDTTGSYHRLRQEAPQGGPCRTIEFTTGIKAIVCAAGRGLPPGVPTGR